VYSSQNQYISAFCVRTWGVYPERASVVATFVCTLSLCPETSHTCMYQDRRFQDKKCISRQNISRISGVLVYLWSSLFICWRWCLEGSRWGFDAQSCAI
jgi:hypothetical protein